MSSIYGSDKVSIEDRLALLSTSIKSIRRNADLLSNSLQEPIDEVSNDVLDSDYLLPIKEFDEIEDLKNYLLTTGDLGYALVTKRSNSSSIIYDCSRHEVASKSQSHSLLYPDLKSEVPLRKTYTNEFNNCPFSLKCCKTKENKWTFRLVVYMYVKFYLFINYNLY